MIDRFEIEALTSPDLVGKELPIAGFVDSIRKSGNSLAFLDIRDETAAIQTVHFEGDSEPGEVAKLIAELTPESVVAISGVLVADDRIRSSRNPYRLPGLELQINDMELISKAQSGLPVTGDSGLDKRLQYRALDLRRPEKILTFKVGSTLEKAMYDHWTDLGYTIMHSAKLVGVPTEGGAEVFHLDYFGETASLTQSPQFAKQKAIAAGLKGYAEVGAAYRRQNSNTTRHLTEFTGVDVEIAWVSDHGDVMDSQEALIRAAFGDVIKAHGGEIEMYTGRKLTLPEGQFPRITLSEARRLVEETGHVIPDSTKDLDPESERIICRIAEERFGSEFVFITDFPTDVRPFYHMRHADDPGLTRSFDLLWRGVEVSTGAQREHRVDILQAQIAEKGLETGRFEDYLNNFRFGCPPHGGYGIGLNRLLAKIMDHNSVSEATFQPNTPRRLTS